MLRCIVSLKPIGCFLVCFALSGGAAQVPLRMAHTYERSIEESFLRRARESGCTHVIAEFQLNRYSEDFQPATGEYLGDRDSSKHSLRDRLVSLFILAEKRGLRLVPKIQTGSMHSGHWGHINHNVRYVDPDIGEPFMDRTAGQLGLENCFSPAFAGNAPLDSSFAVVMRIVAGAFSLAHSSFQRPGSYEYVDFVHLGHDEPCTDKRQVNVAPGKTHSGAEWIWHNVEEHGNVVRRSLESGEGYEYYSGVGGIAVRGVVELMAREMQLRVAQIRATTGLENAKVLMYADAWDPQHNGKLFGTSELLSYPFGETFRKSVVLVPWCYKMRFTRSSLGFSRGWVYDEELAFGAISRSGYDFVVCYSLASGRRGSISSGRRKRLQRNVSAMSAVPGPGRNLGYMTAAWAPWNTSDPPEGYKTMEALQEALEQEAK